jgi:hypothetical protein
MGPRMKEKELRLALVCYGGVSLALYMHGAQGNPESFAGVKSISFDFEIRTSRKPKL